MPLSRVLLIVPGDGYRTGDFVDAARALRCDVVIASDSRQLVDRSSVRLDLRDPERAARQIVDAASARPLDAVVAADDAGVVPAAIAAAELGLRHNPPDAAMATRDKLRMRELLAGAGVPQPAYVAAADAEAAATAAASLGYPCVVKPRTLSASTGVQRADGPEALRAAAGLALTLDEPPLLVERFAGGPEIAVEALLRDGRLEPLAVFDKPDPLDGPTFPETLYVTPSRHPDDAIEAALAVVAAAASAIGLRDGPVHAEVRLATGGPLLLEVAGRTIGGLCGRTLRFGLGISLEQLVLRAALGRPLGDLRRADAASGVLMLPVPAAGIMRGVHGIDEARGVPGVIGVEITVPPGREVQALPLDGRYLGFVFARGPEPAAVEASLRAAGSLIRPDIAGRV
jgi:biotin carboxylase